jgi:uncharacterized protein YbcV (DUF1398 family)
MDTKIIDQSNAESLAGNITFPEVVRNFAETGVERYIADLAQLKTQYYGTNGEYHSAALTFSDAPAIAQTFSAEEVKSAITDIQQQKIKYPDFLRRVMAAGCTHYEVYIQGRQAIYFGRDGSQHIEKFPATK